MTEFALLCQLVVAGVFTVSGLSKALDPEGTRDAVAAFGVPAWCVRPVAVLLPALELAVAVALAGAPGSRTGAVAALVLLTVLTLGVVDNLRRGRRPECHCFGRWGSSDISARTVVRNLVLLTVAAFAVLTPLRTWREHAGARPTGTLALLVLLAGTIVLAIVVAEAGANRRAASRRRAQDPSPVHGAAPRFRLTSLTGAQVCLHDLLDGERPLLLTFLSPGCGPCKRLRPAVARWGELFHDRLQTAVVVVGPAAANRSAFGDSGVPVLLDEDRVVAGEYGVASRPSAVVVSPSGRLLGPVAAGEAGVRRLVGALLADELEPAPASVEPETLTLSSPVRPRPAVTSRPAEGDLLVVTDESTGASASLDPLAALVWQCLDGRSPLSEIAEDLAAAFGASPQVVAEDVLSLVRHLGGLGLLAGVAPLTEPAQHQHPEPVHA